MTAAPTPHPAAGSGLPILGQLSPVGRAFLIGTVAVSLLAIVLDFGLHVDETVLFLVSAAGILGLAWVVGLSTERLGSLTGPQVGGILNATFGNIAELIIAFFALQAGLIDVVKASITGSIIGNLLLVLGASVLVGGLRHGTQTFSQRIAGSNAALLVVAAIGLFVPAVFAFSSDPGQGTRTEESVLVSRGVDRRVRAVAHLPVHATRPRPSAATASRPGTRARPGVAARRRRCVLLLAAVLLAVLSEILVSSIDPFIEAFGLTPFFVGVVLIPTIGNLAEHLVAVQLAYKDKMEFAMAVSYGSSLQVALFVAPVLVLLGRGHGPADGPRLPAARGRRRRRRSRDQRAHRARRRVELARGRAADDRVRDPGLLVLRVRGAALSLPREMLA